MTVQLTNSVRASDEVPSPKSEQMVYELGAEDSWSPFSNPDGTGISNTIVKEAFRAEGVQVAFKVGPYARLLRLVETGDLVGLFNVTREPSTESKYLFGREKLFRAKTAYYHHVDRPLTVSAYDQLQNGEMIGMILGYEYGPFILQNSNVQKIRVNRQENLILMLERGRIDAAILFDAIAAIQLEKSNTTGIIKRAFDGQHSDIYVAFSRLHPDAEYLLEKLDAGLRKLQMSGRIKELMPTSTE
ncbi:substrate-binding periplasmic protein [Kordiimonas sediminis]|uniref:substrate-binding periplasmic protein n=1 Tax=Kordiimonas sediminis TaxID=1735581 RepID=UPI00174BF473|nr:transporter substrate-binding domain-containing protein [Kordiimonas sediminis]